MVVALDTKLLVLAPIAIMTIFFMTKSLINKDGWVFLVTMSSMLSVMIVYFYYPLKGILIISAVIILYIGDISVFIIAYLPKKRIPLYNITTVISIVAFFIFPISIIIFSIPNAIIPFHQQDKAIALKTTSPINTFNSDYIEKCIKNIKQTLISTEQNITKEKGNIDKFQNRIINTVKGYNKELKKLEKERNKLYKDVKYCREIISISEEKAKFRTHAIAEKLNN